MAEDIRETVKRALDSGLPPETVKALMKEGGHSDAEIEAAFSSAKPEVEPIKVKEPAQKGSNKRMILIIALIAVIAVAAVFAYTTKFWESSEAPVTEPTSEKTTTEPAQETSTGVLPPSGMTQEELIAEGALVKSAAVEWLDGTISSAEDQLDELDSADLSEFDSEFIRNYWGIRASVTLVIDGMTELEATLNTCKVDDLELYIFECPMAVMLSAPGYLVGVAAAYVEIQNPEHCLYGDLDSCLALKSAEADTFLRDLSSKTFSIDDISEDCELLQPDEDSMGYQIVQLNPQALEYVLAGNKIALAEGQNLLWDEIRNIYELYMAKDSSEESKIAKIVAAEFVIQTPVYYEELEAMGCA